MDTQADISTQAAKSAADKNKNNQANNSANNANSSTSATPIIGIPTIATPSAFVAQFPVSSQNFIQTLSPHVGQMTPSYKFAPPSATTMANLTAFLQALDQYDQNPSDALITQLNNLMQQLDISAIRLQELENDAVIFYPNHPNGQTPFVTGVTLVWRFGLTKETGNAATLNNPLPQFIIFDPHPGQDGTLNAITTQFLAGAKVLVSHLFNPNVAKNPNFKGNPITHSNIKRFSDPAHSDTTAFVPVGQTLFTIYPKATCTITHGMGGKPNLQLLAGNDYNSRFFQNGTLSFDLLLSIALATQQTATGAIAFPNNPNFLMIESPLPGRVNVNGKSVPLASRTNVNAVVHSHVDVDNSDTVGHMANGVTKHSVFGYGTQSDRGFFVEFGARFRTPGSYLMSLFAKAQIQANEWYAVYDPTIHDPWKLAQNFPDVYNDMTLYKNLYDPTFIQQYKEKGINPYNTSSSAAAVQDAAQLLAVDQSANVATSTDVNQTDEVDLTDPDEQCVDPTVDTSTPDATTPADTVTATNATASLTDKAVQALTFSAAALGLAPVSGNSFAPLTTTAAADADPEKPNQNSTATTKVVVRPS
jgi:hypothetical protein